MAASLFSPQAFAPFNVRISDSPPITLHGTRSTTAQAAGKPPLLLLHGYPQTHVIWHKVAPALSERFNLIMPDLRGYGGSSKPPSPSATDHSLYSKTSMAADVSALMRKLGFAEYSVLGHDRGARVTQALCTSEQGKKEVQRAMLLDIVPTLAMYDATDKVVAAAYWHWFFLVQPPPFPEETILAAPEAFGRKTLAGMPKGEGRGTGDLFPAEAYMAYEATFRDKDWVHATCEDYRAGYTVDCEEQRADLVAGRKIACPFRVLWGKMGLVEKMGAVEQWKKVSEEGCLDPKSEAVDSGHYIPEEVPEKLIEHALEFFSRSGDEKL